MYADLWGRLDPKYDAQTRIIVIGNNGVVYDIFLQNFGKLVNIDMERIQVWQIKTSTVSVEDAWIPEIKDGYTIIVTHTIVLDDESDD